MDNEKNSPDQNPPKRFKWSHLLILAFLLLCVVGVTTVTTVIMAAMGSMPNIEDLDITSYNVTSYIVDKDGDFVDKLSANNNHIQIKYNEISPNMIKSVVAIEDKRFYKHHGIDPIRIGGAFIANLRAGHIVQGGSTITQQLAGMALNKRDEKSYSRKIQEAVLALRIEKQYSKEDIITAYLNRVYLGVGNSGMNCYGVEAAANDLFGKHASELTIAEGAMIAGIIQNPAGHSPINNPDNALARRGQVLQALLTNKYITEADYQKATNAPLNLSTISVSPETETQTYNQSYIDAVITSAAEKLGLEKDINQLYTGGYIIHTRLDQALQKYMFDYFNSDYNFPGGASNETLQAAMVIMDASSGGVRAMVGGRHLDENRSRGWNYATQSTRQPGSAFKPIFVYAPAFEKGYGTGSVFKDAPFRSDSGHEIKNADLQYHGDVTIRKAIADSYNTVAVRVLQEIGIKDSLKFAKNIGISTLVEKGNVNDETLSAGLGGLTKGVSVMDMAGAYGAFADGGVYTEPNLISKITDEKGRVIWEEKAERHKGMSPQTAYMVTSCLQSVVYEGIGGAAALGDGRTVVGKTGTTDNSKDFWFAGYTPQLVGVVWMGFDTPAPIYGTSTNAAVVFSNIMTYAHRDLPAENFERPEGLVDVLIDTKTGKLATRSTPYAFRHMELYASGTEPTTYSSANYANYYRQQQQQNTAQQQQNTQSTDQQGQQQNQQQQGQQNTQQQAGQQGQYQESQQYYGQQTGTAA